LPGFANSEGANTAVLPENNIAIDTYFKVAEDKFRQKAFNYKQHEDQLAKIAETTNFDTKGILDKDEPLIREKIFGDSGVIKFYHDHPDAIDPSSPLYMKGQNLWKDTDLSINRSKQRKLYVDETYKAVVDKKLDPDVLPTVDEFKNGGLDAEWKPLTPKVDFNIYDVLKQAKLSYELGDPEDSGIEGVKKIPKVPTDESVKQNVDAMWLSPSVQQEFGNKDAFAQVATPLLKSMKGEDVLHNIPGFGSNSFFGGMNQKDQVALYDRLKLLKQIKSGDEQAIGAFQTTNYNGQPIKFAEFVTDEPEKTTGTLPIGTGFDVSVTGNSPSGKKYVKVKTADHDHRFDVSDDQGLLDMNNQLNNGGVNVPTELIKKAMDEGFFGGGQAQQKQKSYSLNGESYSQSDVEAAAKASNMTVDEYIKKAGLK